jgi:hypothetical protein
MTKEDEMAKRVADDDFDDLLDGEDAETTDEDLAEQEYLVDPAKVEKEQQVKTPAHPVVTRPIKVADNMKEYKAMQAQKDKIAKDLEKRKAPKRFSPFYQEARCGVAYTDTGEPIIEGIPVWAAQMYADIKSDLDEIKELIGKNM